MAKQTAETANQKLIRESGLSVPAETKILPMSYNVDSSFTYEQVARNQYAAIYKDKTSNNWEVFQIKIRKGRLGVIKGAVVVFPTAERIPTDNDFGTWANHHSTLEAAMAKFELLTKQGEERAKAKIADAEDDAE